ncbi:MAG: ribonuclease HII [Bacteroidales bacterium]|nr:ribonuclease HII [Bacteroidales bacterium]
MLKSTYGTGKIEAGCDEAGRGCLCGPVYAAAVILPSDYHNHELDDSKKLTQKKREKLRFEIEKEAVSFAVASVDNNVIDQINILNASIKAMHLAIEKLDVPPGYLLIDGNRFHAFNDIPYSCIIKGDGIYLSIAAASVLAKTYRDDFMDALSKLYPDYQWDKNKGYPTLFHREAIARFGITPFHRKSFSMQLSLW